MVKSPRNNYSSPTPNNFWLGLGHVTTLLRVHIVAVMSCPKDGISQLSSPPSSSPFLGWLVGGPFRV